MASSLLRRFVSAAFGCAAAFTLPGAPALAAASASAAGDSLEEVTVTARRREESLQVVPIAVTAVSGEEIIKRGIRDAYDLQHSVPALSMATNSTQTKALMPGIRSVATRSFLLLDDAPVGTYFAEGVIGHPWGFGDAMFDIESVQVLKGPQGTLFGRNTTGGAMLIEPNKPNFDGFEGSVRTSFGNYALKQVNAVLNVPLGDVVAIRIAAEHKRRDGYTTNILNGAKRDGVGNDAVRFQLTLRPNEHITSNTIIDYLDEDATPSGVKVTAVYGPNGGFGLFGPTAPVTNAFVGLTRILQEQQARDPWKVAMMGGTNFALPTTDPRYAATAQDQSSPLKCDPTSALFVPNHYCRTNLSPRETLRNVGILNNTSIEFGAVTVKNIYSYRDMKHRNEDAATFPFGSPTFFTGFTSAGQPQVSIAGGGQADQNNKLKQVADELQIQGKAFGDRLDWATGLFYMREWGEEYSPSYTNGPTWSSTQGSGKNESRAVFAQGTFALTDQLKLTLGARETWDKRLAVDTSFAQSGLTFICQTFNRNAAGVEVRDTYPGCALIGNKKWNALSYTASIDYRVTDGTMLYALRSRGYKAGGFSLRAHRPSTMPYNPEFMDNTEIGVKSDWSLGGRPVRTNLSIYSMDYKKQQLQSTVAGTNPVLTFVDNIGKSRIRGAEFEAMIKPVNSLSVSGFLSFTDAKYLKWENNIGTVGGVNYGVVDLSGRPVGFYSKFNAGLSLSWAAPISDSLGALEFRADGAYHSKWLVDQSVAGLVGSPAGPTAIPSVVGYTMVPSDAYGIVNLRADWTNLMGGPLDLGVFVTNATNQDFVTGGAPVNGVVTSAMSPPRMYGLELTYRFGEGLKPRR